MKLSWRGEDGEDLPRSSCYRRFIIKIKSNRTRFPLPNSQDESCRVESRKTEIQSSLTKIAFLKLLLKTSRRWRDGIGGGGDACTLTEPQSTEPIGLDCFTVPPLAPFSSVYHLRDIVLAAGCVCVPLSLYLKMPTYFFSR